MGCIRSKICEEDELVYETITDLIWLGDVISLQLVLKTIGDRQLQIRKSLSPLWYLLVITSLNKSREVVTALYNLLIASRSTLQPLDRESDYSYVHFTSNRKFRFCNVKESWDPSEGRFVLIPNLYTIGSRCPLNFAITLLPEFPKSEGLKTIIRRLAHMPDPIVRSNDRLSERSEDSISEEFDRQMESRPEGAPYSVSS